MNFVEDRLKALEYISKTERGYLHDLITNIGNDIAEEFMRVGFIHTGYSLKYRTWSITNLGKQFYKEVK